MSVNKMLLINENELFYDNNLRKNINLIIDNIFIKLDLSQKLNYAYLALYQELLTLNERNKIDFNYKIRWNSIIRHRILSGNYESILQFCDEITAMIYSLFIYSPQYY